jgi:hypothetical protein
MTAEQVRHQGHVGPGQMCPEARPALDPYQGRPAPNGLPLSDPAVLKRQNLGQRVLAKDTESGYRRPADRSPCP